MPQTQFPLGPTPGVPGMPFDTSALNGGDVVSECAGSDIPFGVMCELNAAGLLVPVQDVTAKWPPTGAAADSSLVGISMYAPFASEQGYALPSIPYSLTGSSAAGWRKGQRVPCVRRGRIWMAYDGGGTPTRIGAFNVWHSSTGASPQGVATFSAVSTTVGGEIHAAPAGFVAFNENGQAGLYTDGFGTSQGILCVGVNLP